MTLFPQDGEEAPLPLAMAALDVAGALRERSATDMAIFGEASGRFSERFLKPETGVALLARAVAEGAAETVAWLGTAAGQRRFRVGLWRQRGGERIRILASFAVCESGARMTGPPVAGPDPALVARIGAGMRAPLDAVAGFAEALRSDPAALEPAAVAAHASDIVAAAWRLQRLSSDLLAASAAPGGPLPGPMGEVDVVRLVRRIARLIAPAARAAGATLGLDALPEAGCAALVLGDESGLWGSIEALLIGAIRQGGEGAAIEVSLTASPDGQTLEIADSAELAGAGRLVNGRVQDQAELAACRDALRASGAELEIGPGEGFRARVIFPAARCLDPA